MTQQSHSYEFTLRNENMYSHKKTVHEYKSFIHNWPNTEATQIPSVEEWITIVYRIQV